MNCSKWLKLVIFFFVLLLSAVVSFNFYLDTYGIRFSLSTLDKYNNTNNITCPTTINLHIFNPQYIFCNPAHFDSFIFGSSFTSIIDPAKINTGKFYNMSYSMGLPAEHLAIIKAFLQKGIRIKSVIIGLDEFSFRISPKEHENQLLRINHPYITGQSLPSLFYLYYFRTPVLFELRNMKDKLLFGKQEDEFILDKNGMCLGWLNIEKKIITSGKPIFVNNAFFTYKPTNYDKKLTNEVFTQIEEMIALSKKNNFSLIFFVNPMHNQPYLNYAWGFIPIKERLASITDFYDFSGFNSVTTNNLNYYEDGHCRYLVGDIIIRRIFGCGNINIPDDFGVLVTKKNVAEYIKKQKWELEKYLTNKKGHDKILQ